MDNLPTFAVHALAAVAAYKYIILFVGVIIEGPFLMIASGFLFRLGYFDFWPLYLTFVTGDLLSDIIWYYLGYFFARPALKKHGKFMGVSAERFKQAEELFHKYHSSILFISKITIGFGIAFAIVMVAGTLKTPMSRFLWLNFLGEILLVAGLLSIGYFFGTAFLQTVDDHKFAFIFGICALAILCTYGLSYYARKKIVS